MPAPIVPGDGATTPSDQDQPEDKPVGARHAILMLPAIACTAPSAPWQSDRASGAGSAKISIREPKDEAGYPVRRPRATRPLSDNAQWLGTKNVGPPRRLMLVSGAVRCVCELYLLEVQARDNHPRACGLPRLHGTTPLTEK